MNPQEEYLRELAGRICIHFPGWDVGKVQSTSFQLNGPDGRGIIFWAGVVDLGNTHGTQFRVSGLYELDAYVANEDKPSIKMTAKKGPEAMARDVQRRFLPQYEAVYARALKTHKEIEQKNTARERVMADLAEWFGFPEVRDCDNHLRYLEVCYYNGKFNYRGKVNANYTSSLKPESERQWEVDLELKSLTIDQAWRIAEALREPAFPPEQLSLL